MNDRDDRVRAHTPEHVNRAIDAATARRVRGAQGASPESLRERLGALDREWDTERVLELNAALVALTGVALGAFVHPYWLLLPAAALGFLAQHAIQGWCPPLAVFRRLGFRTRKEIEEERYALKTLLGDFDAGTASPAAVLAAVRQI